jgi:flagellar biosynthetic protein FliR
MNHVIDIAIPHFQSALIVMFRTAGIFAALPVLGSRTIPMQLKAGLVILLGLVLAPLLPPMTLPPDPLLLGTGMANEVLIGLVIGLAVRLFFAALELAGDLMGTQMGFSVAHLIDPLTAHQTPLVASFQTILASLTFLSLNAHYLVVRSVASSFETIAPFTGHLSAGLAEDVLHLTQQVFVVALKLAAPVLATVLVINVMMAILGRTVPQLNVFVMSFPLTIASGLGVMALALPYSTSLFESEFMRLDGTLQGLLRMLGHG